MVNSRGHYGHLAGTLTAVGFYPYGSYGQSRGNFCPLSPPGKTALASSVSQFSAMCADPSQPRPAITGTAKTEDRRGDSGGRFDTRFCPNPNPIVRWGKVGRGSEATEVRILFLEL